jgi:ribose transport system ATP-binding protein
MEEVFQIADRVTVLRNGQNVITDDVANLTLNEVIDHIVGQKMEAAFEWQEREVERTETPLLEVKELSAVGRFRDVSFRLYPGEILGLAGLMGSGRTEIARALFGIDKVDSGEILVRGRRVSIRGVQDAMDAGISLIPEDRRLQGLILDHSVKDNLLLPLLRRLQRGGVMDDRRGEQMVRSLVERLRVKVNSIFEPIWFLSGGNQQKVVIAKWLAAEPEVLIMDEPTAGVDVAAKSEILDIARNLANSGKGVILISSELVELLAVSDRILVLQEGTVKQVLDRRDVGSEEELHHAVQTV